MADLLRNGLISMLDTQELPKFADIKPIHFEPAVTYVIKNYHAVIARVLAEKAPTFENVVLPLEEARNKIARVVGLIKHLKDVDGVKDFDGTNFTKAHDAVIPVITEFETTIMQNEGLYEVYKKLRASSDFAKYDAAQKAIIENAIRDAELSGVQIKDVELRTRLIKIKAALSTLGEKFSRNLTAAQNAAAYHITDEKMLVGIAKTTIAAAAKKATAKGKTGWILNLDAPCYNAVMSSAQNRELRKNFYTIYYTVASDQAIDMDSAYDNGPVITEILKLRQELAALLGYTNYAEYSLVSRMAKSAGQVEQFLRDLSEQSKTAAEREFAELEKFAIEIDRIDRLEAWDVSYYAKLYKASKLKFDEEKLREYFPVEQVLTGMFWLVKNLYGITIEEIVDGDKWADSVKLFTIMDSAGNLRGKFYIDLYTREGKRTGSWVATDDLLPRFRNLTGFVQIPVELLGTNFDPSVHEKGLAHSQVVTLFHEFGHILHHLLTQVNYPSVAGTKGVAKDAVELPSQFMENWCWEWEVIQKITQDKLPREYFDKLLEVKNFHSSRTLTQQLELAFFDFRVHLHQGGYLPGTVQQIYSDVRKLSVRPTPDFNRHQNRFTHVFGGIGEYAACYFSYRWSEVLSSDVFGKFKEAGEKAYSKIGELFLRTLLEKGGSKPTMDLFLDFMGRMPRIDAFLRDNGIIIDVPPSAVVADSATPSAASILPSAMLSQFTTVVSGTGTAAIPLPVGSDDDKKAKVRFMI